MIFSSESTKAELADEAFTAGDGSLDLSPNGGVVRLIHVDSSHVEGQALLVLKVLATQRARNQIADAVRVQMGRQFILALEGHVTNVALERSDVAVRRLVPAQVVLLSKDFAADVAAARQKRISVFFASWSAGWHR